MFMEQEVSVKDDDKQTLSVCVILSRLKDELWRDSRSKMFALR
jgi:hypothetical protein